MEEKWNLLEQLVKNYGPISLAQNCLSTKLRWHSSDFVQTYLMYKFGVLFVLMESISVFIISTDMKINDIIMLQHRTQDSFSNGM